jgi:hypothetical protein
MSFLAPGLERGESRALQAAVERARGYLFLVNGT